MQLHRYRFYNYSLDDRRAGTAQTAAMRTTPTVLMSRCIQLRSTCGSSPKPVGGENKANIKK